MSSRGAFAEGDAAISLNEFLRAHLGDGSSFVLLSLRNDTFNNV